MKLNQIEVLRKQGWKIRVTHYRWVVQARRNGSSQLMLERRDIDKHNGSLMAHIPYVIQPCGGRVIVEITNPDGVFSTASSWCHQKDNFNRKIGTTMAFGRAMMRFFPRKKAPLTLG